jgi:hypothetical protein
MELSDLASIQDLLASFGRREPSPNEEFSDHTLVLRLASKHLPGSVIIVLTMIFSGFESGEFQNLFIDHE